MCKRLLERFIIQKVCKNRIYKFLNRFQIEYYLVRFQISIEKVMNVDLKGKIMFKCRLKKNINKLN